MLAVFDSWARRMPLTLPRTIPAINTLAAVMFASTSDYERERKWQKDVGYETHGSALSFVHKTDIPGSLSTDIPQMTSKFAEIVPRPHLQGNSVPIAAIR